MSDNAGIGVSWSSTQSFWKLEDVDGWKRLKVDYAILGLEETRTQIFMRRVGTVLATEEKRLYSLTDAQAIAELDALKAEQDKQFVKKLDS